MSLRAPTPPVDSHGGHVTRIYGPMFSGKSTELQRRVRRARISHHEVYVVSFAGDVRSPTGQIESRDAGCMEAHEHRTLAEVMSVITTAGASGELPYTCVAIDEAQFFGHLPEFCDAAARLGMSVIVAGLDWTSTRSPFPVAEGLSDINHVHADESVPLTAMCMTLGCERQAAFTGANAQMPGTVNIGDVEAYSALCRGCYDREHPEVFHDNPFKFVTIQPMAIE